MAAKVVIWRSKNGARIHPHRASLDCPLANPEFFLNDGDDFLTLNQRLGRLYARGASASGRVLAALPVDEKRAIPRRCRPCRDGSEDVMRHSNRALVAVGA